MGNQTALIFGAVGYPDWSFLAPLRAAAAVFCRETEHSEENLTALFRALRLG